MVFFSCFTYSSFKTYNIFFFFFLISFCTGNDCCLFFPIRARGLCLRECLFSVFLLPNLKIPSHPGGTYHHQTTTTTTTPNHAQSHALCGSKGGLLLVEDLCWIRLIFFNLRSKRVCGRGRAIIDKNKHDWCFFL